MPTKRIGDLADTRPVHVACKHPDHRPPEEQEVLRQAGPGIYEHVCSACGTSTKFTVGGSPDHPIDRQRR